MRKAKAFKKHYSGEYPEQQYNVQAFAEFDNEHKTVKVLEFVKDELGVLYKTRELNYNKKINLEHYKQIKKRLKSRKGGWSLCSQGEYINFYNRFQNVKDKI